MKRSLGSSTELSSPRASKRQASLAGFLQPKLKNGTSPKKVKLEEGKEGKPIIIDIDDETQSVFENVNKPLMDKGKGKAIEIESEIQNIKAGGGEEEEDGKSTDENLDTSWPPKDHPYHPPPSSNYNHPILIGSIPNTLKPIHFIIKPKIINNPITDLDLIYYKSFINPKLSSNLLMNYLLENLPWYRVKYMVRGMNINTPRYTTVFGKDSTLTPWNGYQKCNPRAIPEILERLMRKVNYYSSGDDSISYHSDSESFLGLNPTIASLTLGQSRDFLLRHINFKNHPKTGKEIKIEKFNLQDGDLLIMKGKTQHEWQHSIPKRKNLNKGRINITFRKGIIKYSTENYYNYNVGKGNLYKWDSKKKVMVESLPSDGGVK
uniref:Fe2OG dioxygenase domain-containing protein n=1 Tax=Kwoniella pini CBS 10737 TaxID=1296096 RepID=A0A1B9I9U0_9TREE|nr:uncharacterized protein I206_01671 [Kwoniella pini CBS 10737]OCF52382.1 hypothetical protein I206_01671 [Kwoniella pini CBS 10737]